jgi:hypothetical protein
MMFKWNFMNIFLKTHIIVRIVTENCCTAMKIQVSKKIVYEKCGIY